MDVFDNVAYSGLLVEFRENQTQQGMVISFHEIHQQGYQILLLDFI